MANNSYKQIHKLIQLDDRAKITAFCQFPPNTRQQILRVLIKKLSIDPDANMRNKIADCIIALSTTTFTKLTNEYKNMQFIESIFELCNISDTNHLNIITRCNALIILARLCSLYCTNPLIKQNQKSITQIYRGALKLDSNGKVHIAALQAIELTLKPLQSQHVLEFIPLMLDILKLLQNTLNNEIQEVNKLKQHNYGYIVDNNDYQQTQYIMAKIIQIVCDKPILFADHDNANNNQITSALLSYCKVLTEIAATKHLPDKVRALSLDFFIFLVENDPSMARKNQIIAKSVINICMDHFLLSQIDDKEWDELPYGEDIGGLPSIVKYALDRLVNALKPIHVLPAIYSKLGIVSNTNERNNNDNNQYWKDEDWRRRYSAVTVITHISHRMKHEKNEVIMVTNKCLELLGDTNYRVQYAAIKCIVQLSGDHFYVLTNRFSDIILNNLLMAMNINNHIKIQTHSCSSLIYFVCSLEQRYIAQKVDALNNGLMDVLKNSSNQWQKCKNNQMELKANYMEAMEQSLAAMTALAECAGNLFNQHDNFNELKNASLTLWFKRFPLESECVEGETFQEYLFKLLQNQNQNPIIVAHNLSNFPFLLKLFAKIRNNVVVDFVNIVDTGNINVVQDHVTINIVAISSQYDDYFAAINENVVYSEEVLLGSIFNKIIQKLQKGYDPLDIMIQCVSKDSFTGLDGVDAFFDAHKKVQFYKTPITNYTKDEIINKGLFVVWKIRYHHKIQNISINCHHMNKKKNI